MLQGTRTQLLASAAAGFAVCTPAYAQDAPTSAQTAVSQATNVAPTNQTVTDDNSQAIVVTAQKRAQVLLDVPASVTVIGGDTLERHQATNFEDYVSLVPGFSINGSTAGVTRVTLRGANTGGVASTVAIFMDDVPFGSSTGLANGSILSGDFDPFDLNRIEVLRGPQGTLYGASSFGGVLRYITNAPKLNKFEARASGWDRGHRTRRHRLQCCGRAECAARRQGGYPHRWLSIARITAMWIRSETIRSWACLRAKKSGALSFQGHQRPEEFRWPRLVAVQSNRRPFDQATRRSPKISNRARQRV